MNRSLRLVVALYGALLRLYPLTFRREFAAEMGEVFARTAADAARHGWPGLIRLCLRETRTFPANILREHLHITPASRGGIMSKVCPRCDYEGADDARYCARCGRAYLPAAAPLVRLATFVNAHMRPVLLLLMLGVALFLSYVASSALYRPMFFPLSYGLLLLFVSGVALYMGWQWNKPQLTSQRLKQVALLIVTTVAVGTALLAIDGAYVSRQLNEGMSMSLDLPGIESEWIALPTGGSYRDTTWTLSREVYLLVLLGYTLLLVTVGYLLSKRTRPAQMRT